jgi:hypothetical protein
MKWRNPKTAPLAVLVIVYERHASKPQIKCIRGVRQRASLIGWLPLSVLPPKPEIDMETGEVVAGQLNNRRE